MIRSVLGKYPRVAASAFVDGSAQVIGDVELGERASVWMGAVLRGDVNSIQLGADSNVQDNAVLHGMLGMYPVRVGQRCTIGHNATVHGCTLEDEVLVGIGAIVLNGAVVGSGSIVAAGALVAERSAIPPGSLVVGVPGRVKRALTGAERESIEAYAARYVEYARWYQADSAPAR